MANAFRLGYYALSPMTQAKSFRDNPVLGSTVLNRLGLHLFRVAAAAAFTRMRRAVLRPMISAADAQALQRDGFVTKRDFLPQGQFQELRAQVETLDASVHTMLEGETVTERIYVDETTLGLLPALRALLEVDLPRLRGYPTLWGSCNIEVSRQCQRHTFHTRRNSASR